MTYINLVHESEILKRVFGSRRKCKEMVHGKNGGYLEQTERDLLIGKEVRKY